MATADRPAPDRLAFDLKGTALTLMVLRPLQMDAALIGRQLEERSARAPSFFHDAPLVVDLSAVETGPEELDLGLLVDSVRRAGMVPVGLRGGTAEQRERARQAGLGWISGASNGAEGGPTPPAAAARPAARRPAPGPAAASEALIVTQPVRSGQRIVAPEGDLIVLGPVNPGAEVLAGRHIHVYGALRGRALAGASGDTQARIFCLQFAPELVAIAGEYVVSDELDAECLGAGAMVYLEDGILRIEPAFSVAAGL